MDISKVNNISNHCSLSHSACIIISMEYELIRSKRKTLGIEIRGGRVIVRSPLSLSDQRIDEFVNGNEAWIRKCLAKAEQREKEVGHIDPLSYDEIERLADEALKYIPERVAHYAGIIGVSYGRITIRNQRTRWGSCSSNGNLNFNCLLMLAPPEVIDSVVVHELCHLKEMNHSASFYEEVHKAYPDYDRWDAWLRKNGAAIMMRMRQMT